MANNDISDATQDLSSLLSSDERDFLVHNNGDKVKISSLKGKIVGLFFSRSSSSTCLKFIPKLVEIYEQFASIGEFEVVFVSSDENGESFNGYFSKMPWLAVPFSDSASRNRLMELFDLHGVFTLVIFDKNGQFANKDGTWLVLDYGVEGYPFTNERVEFLKEKEEITKKNQTLSSVLVSRSRDYLFSNDGNKVRVSEVVGKTVLLYFSVHWCPSRLELMPRLVRIYHELKAKGEAFEVIYISSDCCQSTFDEAFSSMPWLALPFGDKRKRYLERMCKVQTLPTVIAIGSSGKTVNWDAQWTILVHGADAYPFTEEHLKHLEEKAIPNWLPKKLKHELHSQHQHVLTRWKGFNFDGYDSVGNGLSFYCVQCNFDLHLECALVNDEEGKYDQKENHEGLLCEDVCHGA